jgi:hypothetical protein
MVRTTVRVTYLAACGVALALVLGCGGPEKPVAHLRGKVMFKGQPVPAGYISFLPDSSKGNQGSMKVVQIKDGEYDSSLVEDSGLTPGPTVIRIAGFDGKKIRLYAQGKQIFNAYELRDTLAEGSATRDFVVPDSAADNLQIVPTADH